MSEPVESPASAEPEGEAAATEEATKRKALDADTQLGGTEKKRKPKLDWAAGDSDNDEGEAGPSAPRAASTAPANEAAVPAGQQRPRMLILFGIGKISM